MKTLLHGIAILVVVSLTNLCFAADGSVFKPPAGAKVAVVVLEDLECPSCAHAYPLVWETARAHKVPVMLHDFPLSNHPWSFQAAIYARFFDTKSENLGNDFRGYIYQNQPDITPGNLHQYAQKFADDHKVSLPFAVDPQGELKAKILADRDLGTKAGLIHTPTIFVVGIAPASPSYIEVGDLDKLGQAIEEMKQKVPASTGHVPAHRARGRQRASSH